MPRGVYERKPSSEYQPKTIYGKVPPLLARGQKFLGGMHKDGYYVIAMQMGGSNVVLYVFSEDAKFAATWKDLCGPSRSWVNRLRGWRRRRWLDSQIRLLKAELRID